MTPLYRARVRTPSAFTWPPCRVGENGRPHCREGPRCIETPAAVSAHPVARASAEAPSILGVARQAPDRPRKRACVGGRYENAPLAATKRLASVTDVGDHRTCPRRHVLEDLQRREPEALHRRVWSK